MRTFRLLLPVVIVALILRPAAAGDGSRPAGAYHIDAAALQMAPALRDSVIPRSAAVSCTAGAQCWPQVLRALPFALARLAGRLLKRWIAAAAARATSPAMADQWSRDSSERACSSPPIMWVSGSPAT